MLENIERKKIAIKTSEKNFGFTFTVIFALLAFYSLLFDKKIFLLALLVSFTLLFLTILYPKILRTPNILWFKFGLFLNSLISPLIMVFLFYLTFTPTGLIMKLLGKDLLRIKNNKIVDSYWIKRKGPITSLKQQF